MSILEQINNAKTEEELFQLVEEHVLDIETSLSWKEEPEKLAQEGDTEKAELLKAAEKRWHNLEKL